MGRRLAGCVAASFALVVGACGPTVPDLPLAGPDLVPDVGLPYAVGGGPYRCSEPYPRTIRIETVLGGPAKSLTVSIGPGFSPATPMHLVSGTTWRSDAIAYDSTNTVYGSGGFRFRFDVETNGGTHSTQERTPPWGVACIP